MNEPKSAPQRSASEEADAVAAGASATLQAEPDELQDVPEEIEKQGEEASSGGLLEVMARIVSFEKSIKATQEKSHDVAIKFASVAIGINFFSWGVAFTLEALFGDGGWVYAVFAGLFYAISAFFFALTFVRRFKLRAILEKLFSDKV